MNGIILRMLGATIGIATAIMAVQTVSAQAPAAAPATPAAVAPAAAPEAAPAAAPAAAPEAKAPEVKPALTSALELRKTGVVSVTKDASGKVTGLKLIVNMYEIPLDEGSKPLENMDGQKVRVTGTFSSEGGKRLFYVKGVEGVAAEGAAAPAAPAGKPAEAAPTK